MTDSEKFTIIKLNSIDSTNEELKRKSTELNNYTVLTANNQSNGKGRKDRTWISDEGNLFASILIKNAPVKEPFYFPFITALAIQSTIPNSKIKWPNDILLSGKKLAGILIEKSKSNVIIGFGINITNHPTDNTLYKTTSLINEGIEINKNDLLNQVLKQFNKFEKLNENEVIKKINKNLAFINEKVTISDNNTTYTGNISFIDNKGNLVINNNNKPETINFGEII